MYLRLIQKHSKSHYSQFDLKIFFFVFLPNKVKAYCYFHSHKQFCQKKVKNISQKKKKKSDCHETTHLYINRGE